ncbi:hypothetical protein ACFFLS_09960 [Flavobacterium procerum]|uniref:Trimeric autotransporter adhesin YadA-like head domain-containing protein n=1 Tax=Flavobacterium procerum TaxID=1455569 RepID=A0ABV6BPJ0_9FLAO
MPIQTLEIIKSWFKTGLKPTEQQFSDTWDSFRHKDEKVSVQEIEGVDALTPNISEVLTKGNNYYTNGQNDYMVFSNQYAPGWQFNRMQFMPGGVRVEKSHGGKTDGIVYGGDHLGSIYSRSDYANEVGFNLSTEGLLLKTNTSESGTGIIKTDNLTKVTDYQLPAETTEPSVTLVSKVNGIPADVNGNVIIEAGGSQSPVSATESGIVTNDSLQELGGTDKKINGIRIGKGNANFENNLVIGRNGLASVTTGQYNVAIGNGDGEIEGPLQYLTTGQNNTMVGSDAGISTTTGNHNTGIGAAALFTNTTGSSNTALGVSALRENTTGTFNDAFGRRALSKNTTATANTAVGSLALAENATSPFNVAIGCSALSKMVSALGQSTAIGAYCMSDATGTDKNAAIGTYALRYNTSGFSNTAIGHTALGLNTSGHSNNAVGNYSLGAVTTGIANTGIGKFAGRYITTGSFNIYIGSEGLPEDAAVDGIINIGNRFVSRGSKLSLNGAVNIGTAPVYENNAAALAAGLKSGDVYRTSVGVLMIAF